MNDRHTDQENELLAFIEPDGTWRTAYMYHAGDMRNRLTDSQWAKYWLLGDGFDHVDREFAAEQCWDWSHVRDSSEQALAQMWEAIKRFDPKHP